MNTHDKWRLGHILESIDHAESFIAGLDRPDLETNRQAELALRSAIGIIGEAANHLSDEFRQAHPEIDWRAIVGMRNWLVHAYYRVNLDTLWETAFNDLPILKQQIQTIFEQETQDDDTQNPL